MSLIGAAGTPSAARRLSQPSGVSAANASSSAARSAPWFALRASLSAKHGSAARSGRSSARQRPCHWRSVRQVIRIEPSRTRKESAVGTRAGEELPTGAARLPVVR